jgi:hypothetical protein
LSGEEEELSGGREGAGAGGGAEVEHFVDLELRLLRVEGAIWKMVVAGARRKVVGRVGRGSTWSELSGATWTHVSLYIQVMDNVGQG